ncbi:MAG: ComEC/Rec2 family competence protein [Bacteroidota bacterium]|nr:ComEC/Rec2 family competence protein [Bacteroidota bacterium]
MDAIKNPFVAFFFPFVIGIIAGIYLHLHFQLVFYVLISIPFFAYSIIEKKIFSYKSSFFGFYAYFFLIILGIFIVDVQRVEKPDIDTNNYILYEGIIVEQPKIKEKSIQSIIDIQAYKDSIEWEKIETKVVVYFGKDSSLQNLAYGDRIVFKARLNSIENAGNPNEFDYKAFMSNKGIFNTAFVKSSDLIILEHKQANILIYNALKIRQSLMSVYQRFEIEGQRFAVLSALTLGYRDNVDKETRQKFANTGAMHILAVSGLHVGIIFMILTNLLAFMDKKRHLMIIKSIIIIISLWFFATIAGLSPSVMRSALMFSMFVIGKILMRSTSIYNIIFASAFILLLLNPFGITSVSFQLSYAAVLSIVFFQPYFYKLFVFQRWLPDKIWALTSVSVAAQLGTMPIGLFYFHQFPNYFFLTNILVIPLASMILYVAVILFTVSFIPFLNMAVAFVLKVLLKWLTEGVAFIDSLPFATMKDIYISSQQMFLIYVIILSFTLFWIYNNKKLLYTFFISLIVFLLVDMELNYSNSSKNELVIYNVRNGLTINLINGENILLAKDKLLTDNKTINYSIKPYWQQKRICSKKSTMLNIDSLLLKDTLIDQIKTTNNALKIGNVSFYIVRDNKIADNITEKKLNIDYLVLSDNVYVNMEDIIRLLNFKKVIFDGTNKYWRIDKWKEQCDKLGITYFDISSQGAWRIDIDTGKEF